MTSVRSRITIKGTEEIVKNLKNNVDKTSEVSVYAVNQACKILQKSMGKYCPVNKDPKDTDTVHLKESITILQPAKKYKYRVIGKVGPTKNTAIHVEFGTSKMSARPFMRIQPYILRDQVRNVVKDIIKGKLGL